MKKSRIIIIAIEIIIILVLILIHMMINAVPSSTLVEGNVIYVNALENNLVNAEWSNDTIELNLNDFD